MPAELSLQARCIVAGNVALHTIQLPMLIMTSSPPSSAGLLDGEPEEWDHPANRPDPSHYMLDERNENGSLVYDVNSLQKDLMEHNADLKDHYRSNASLRLLQSPLTH